MPRPRSLSAVIFLDKNAAQSDPDDRLTEVARVIDESRPCKTHEHPFTAPNKFKDVRGSHCLATQRKQHLVDLP